MHGHARNGLLLGAHVLRALGDVAFEGAPESRRPWVDRVSVTSNWGSVTAWEVLWVRTLCDEGYSDSTMTDTKARRGGVLDVSDAPCCDPVATAGPVVELDDEQLAGMAKALGHPLRVRIVRLLLDRQTCIAGDLVAELPVAQSTVSEHLRILREAGMVQGEIEGPRISYCVSPDGLAAFRQALGAL